MRIRTIGFLMALSAMLILGMTPNSESKTVQNEWGKVSEGFRLSAHPLSVLQEVDQPVLIGLTIKNVTKRDLEVTEALPRREYEIDVRNSRGQTVPLTDFGQKLLENMWLGFRVRDITVEPGEERQDTVDIAKLRDLSVPGTYYVKAKRRVRKLNGKGWGEVQSNTVHVTIRRVITDTQGIANSSIQQPSRRSTTQQAFLRTLVAARAPGGFVWVMKCRGEEPFLLAEPDISPLQTALESIIRLDPRYKGEIESGVVNLLPSTGEPAMLKTSIERYETTTNLDQALRQLLALKPVKQAASRLGLTQNSTSLVVGPSRFSGGPSEISVEIRATTLREALNALVKAHGRAVWEYRESRCDGVYEFSVNFLAQ